MIHFQKVSKVFGEKTAVKNLELQIPKGELFVFLGPNGAGKTTTIKMLCGLLYPSEGRILIKGYDTVKDHMKIKPLFSYIPDEPYLYDKLTGKEFLHFVGEMYGLEKKKMEAKIEELVELFEASSYINNLCESYSHGMKQRIVIASMLLHEPEVVVVDEPMVGLDPPSARLFKNLLRKLTEEKQTTVFMSTHTLSVAEELAHRVGIIFQGEMVELGTVRELKEKYQFQDKTLEDLFMEIAGKKE
ncbi:MAG: ABC transporter ATP-binding protein [Planctomycetota bacterium]|nr:MAG: ABC transporter ATP-binding protein [Planctomycetota bacterium]